MNESIQNGLMAEAVPASALAGEPKDIAQVLTPYRPANFRGGPEQPRCGGRSPRTGGYAGVDSSPALQ